MKTKHTTGPWEFQESGLIYGPPKEDSDESTFICDVALDEVDAATVGPTPEETANGFLIAASPDLLAAARVAVNLLRAGAARRALVAAIDKAEGKLCE